MQIVIDIPEYIYKICQGHGDIVYKYIAKGTPLPKGHGVLKDVDEIKKNQFTLGTSNYCEYKVVTIEAIDKADTIIKADKAERSE